MPFTQGTAFGALKQLSPYLRPLEVGNARGAALHRPRADEAMRRASAFDGVDDALATEPSYQPKFCLSRTTTAAEREDMLTAGFAFNLAAERAGQARRCFFF